VTLSAIRREAPSKRTEDMIGRARLVFAALARDLIGSARDTAKVGVAQQLCSWSPFDHIDFHDPGFVALNQNATDRSHRQRYFGAAPKHG
jgi:hypothetical protein